jgi:hypothetical protein
MDDASKKAGYSAEVAMWLECGDHGRVSLSQAAPTFVVAAQPISLPAGGARLVMIVDGQRFEHSVRLVDGMDEGTRKAMISLDDSVPPF